MQVVGGGERLGDNVLPTLLQRDESMSDMILNTEAVKDQEPSRVLGPLGAIENGARQYLHVQGDVLVDVCKSWRDACRGGAQGMWTEHHETQ